MWYTMQLFLCYQVFYKSTPKPAPPVPAEEDSDVAAERRNVQALTRNELGQHSLVCKDLTKYYQKFLAVNRLTFGKLYFFLQIKIDHVYFLQNSL